MSSGYTKLFGSILDSTVWETSAEVRIVWMTLLAMADRDGNVGASVPGLAKRANVERAHVEKALGMFTSPDPDSRTKTDEGRRIREIDGGWFIINHAKYREKASAEEYREKANLRQKRYRERHAVTSPVTRGDAPLRSVTESNDIAEASPEAEAHAEQRASGSGARAPDPLPFAVEPEPTQRPSQEPRAIATRLYQAAYEQARAIPWMQANAFRSELDAIGMWAEAAGRREGKATDAVLLEVFKHAFADDWMRANGYPLKAIAKQAGELYKPPPKATPAGPKPAPNTLLLAELRQQRGEVISSGSPKTAQKVKAIDERIAAEYAHPTGIADEPERPRFARR